MLRKIRFNYLLLQAVFRKQWKKFSLVFLLVGVLLLTILSFAPFISSQVTNSSAKFIKPLFVEAEIGNPEIFNPLFSEKEIEKEINSLVFRGLLKISSTGGFEVDMAESYKIVSPTEYEFKLKKDIKWHDGESFSADDVVHTVETAQNPLYESELSSNFRDIKVEKVDDYTVKFVLKEPFAPFLNAVTVGIIPSHIPLKEYKPVGTGPFRFIDVKTDEVTVEGAKNKIKYKFYPTQNTALTALKLGEVHGLGGVNPQENELLNWNNFQKVEKVMPFRLVTAFFNTKNEILSEKAVRQALSYATPKDSLVKVGDSNMGVVALNSYSLLDPIQKSAKEKYVFNLEKAVSLLKTNGWVEGEDGKLYKENKKLELSITTIEDHEFENTALNLKNAWEKLGAQVSVNVVSGLELKNQIVPNRTFSILLTSQLLNTDPDQYVLWHTTQTQGANVSGITSPKLDKLLEDGRKNLDEKVRAEKYQEFSRLLLDETPAIFLYYPNYSWVYSTRVGNVSLENFKEPSDKFNTADDWKIRRPFW